MRLEGLVYYSQKIYDRKRFRVDNFYNLRKFGS